MDGYNGMKRGAGCVVRAVVSDGIKVPLVQ